MQTSEMFACERSVVWAKKVDLSWLEESQENLRLTELIKISLMPLTDCRTVLALALLYLQLKPGEVCILSKIFESKAS